MRLGWLLPLAVMTALLGCDATVAPVAPDLPAFPDEQTDTCGAAPHAGLVGQDATALERVLILRQVRVIRPGQPVTRDLRPDRINFEIDAANRIARIFCG